MRVLIVLLLATISLFAHDLHHKIIYNNAVVVAFSFNGSDDFSYKPYEVYAPGSEIPFAVGRTDKYSRVIFLPDKKGEWVVKVMSEDGHGAVVKVAVDKDMKIVDGSQTLYEKFGKMFVGIALIIAIFTILSFIKKRRD